MIRFLAVLLLALGLLAHTVPAFAQAPTADVAQSASETDRAIEARVTAIFGQIDGLEAVEPSVDAGVVTLSGTVTSQANADRAAEIASSLEGVVTVEDQIERDLDVDTNLSPAIAGLRDTLVQLWRGLPLLGLAIIVFLVVALIFHLLARWSSFWRRVMPNAFLAELAAQAVRFAGIIAGLVAALNLLGAMALMGAILGGAGVIGLAIGFAVRDTVENYIASIMLSLRQPFRANDHVLIDTHEGRVIRLTSRATILMTLDGNHLRVPNAAVFKSVILNYSRNPERRFQFDLGVDAEDDPVAAMATGIAAISALDFILDTPKPDALIRTVGDSNIVITFMAWVDQTGTDFMKARSLAIRAAKDAVEDAGFTLPEPIYRLRFDSPVSGQIAMGMPEPATDSEAGPEPARPSQAPVPSPQAETREVLDVRPDRHIDRKVEEERAHEPGADLLDASRPVE